MKNSRLDALRKTVATLPSSPGVYRWLDDKGDVLYVGKAKNLRSRTRSYVLPKPDASQGPWKLALMQRIADVQWTVTRNELEALILETNLIKELQPKYNVLMKDGKNYVYVRISLKEAFPSVSIVRQIEEDGAAYFGPYLKKYQIDRVLECLHEVFPFRTSPAILAKLNARARESQPLDEPLQARPSWESQIGKHCGLGFGTYTHEEYRAAIDAIAHFLRGDQAEAKAILREEMARAAAGRKFERAGRLRDALSFIENLGEEQAVSDTTGDNTDAFDTALQADYAQVVVLRERGGKIIGERSFALAGRPESAADALRQVLPQYYQAAADLPDLVVIGADIEDRAIIAEWLTAMRGKTVEVRVPERGKKSKLLTMAQRNADEQVRQQFKAWEAATQTVQSALDDLQQTLDLSGPLKRIEGYDISHLGGTETVGSMVVSKNGKAANAEYRSFTIRTLKEGVVDDYAALREVLRRRLRHLIRSLREEEKHWKEQGMTAGKVRKADRAAAAALLGIEPGETGDAVIARRGDDVIAVAALRPLGNNRRLLVAGDNQLRMFLIRRTLARLKKGKVYAVVPAGAEGEYAALYFRHVQRAPDELTPPAGDHIVLMYEAGKNKPDASLSARPDLILIDGGKGQLSAVSEVLRELAVDIPTISLAKREEEIFRRGDPAPVPFAPDSPGRFLLMRLRDEAHRFSNRHREQRLKTKTVRSALDELPGIGPKTRQALWREFGDLEHILAADDQSLLRVISASQLRVLRRLNA